MSTTIPGRLAEKVCIITGGAQGIGAEYVRRLASEGAAVAIVDLSRMEQAEELSADILAAGGRALAIRADVTDEAEMYAMAASVVREFGRVDCLVNNAAIYQDRATATWQMFHDVNVIGMINASNAVVPHFWEQSSGSIINIGSVGAMLIRDVVDPEGPPPRIDPGGYGMTKWMVIYLTRLMARRLGPRNIRVNTVAPGVTLSPGTTNSPSMTPEHLERRRQESAMHAVIDPREMTGVVFFLASDDSAKMTGQVLVTDAGMWFTS